MAKTNMIFSDAGKNIFSPATGYNFRIRFLCGGDFISIKPSTRPRGVKGEYGFETYNPNKTEVVAGIELPSGDWGFEPLKYGWLKLVPVGDNSPVMLTTRTVEEVAVVESAEDTETEAQLSETGNEMAEQTETA